MGSLQDPEFTSYPSVRSAPPQTLESVYTIFKLRHVFADGEPFGMELDAFAVQSGSPMEKLLFRMIKWMKKYPKLPVHRLIREDFVEFKVHKYRVSKDALDSAPELLSVWGNLHYLPADFETPKPGWDRAMEKLCRRQRQYYPNLSMDSSKYTTVALILAIFSTHCCAPSDFATAVQHSHNPRFCECEIEGFNLFSSGQQ